MSVVPPPPHRHSDHLELGRTSDAQNCLASDLLALRVPSQLDAHEHVPWMKPEDCDLQQFINSAPVHVVGRSQRGVIHVAGLDASVHAIEAEADARVRKAMITRAAGESFAFE